MSLQIACKCGKKLQAPDSMAGKNARCPACGNVIQIPAADVELDSLLQELPDPTESSGGTLARSVHTSAASSGDQSHAGGSTRQRMARVANGIKLVFWGTVLMVAAIVVAFVSGMLVVFTGSATPLLGILGAALLSPIGTVLSIVGRVMCLAVPGKVGAKALIIPAVICDLASAALRIADHFQDLPPLLGLLASALWLATLILFVLFLKAVATYLGQESLTENAQMVIILVVICVISTFGSLLPFGFLFVIAALVSMLVAVLKYLNLLQHVAEAARP